MASSLLLISFLLVQNILTSPIDASLSSRSLKDRGLFYETWGTQSPYRVYCYTTSPPTNVLILSDPKITFETPLDMCYSNPTVNAGCHCEKRGEHVILQQLVCSPNHFKDPAAITSYCQSSCECYYGGPLDDGFPRSPDWYKPSKCKKTMVYEDRRNVLQVPVYCMQDDECGDGCFCNGQEDGYYMSGPISIPGPKKYDPKGTVYTQLRTVLGAGLPDGFGVCGEKYVPSGTDGVAYPLGFNPG